MDVLFTQISDDAVCRTLIRFAAGQGLTRGGLFVLVAARLAGLLFVGPLLGRTILTWHVRLGLVVLAALIVTPTLPTVHNAANDLQFVSHEEQTGGAQSNWQHPSLVDVSTFPADFALAAIAEAAIGAAIGVGVAVLLSGLKLGGEWFDRHSGLGIGSVLNPEFTSGGAAPAEMLWLFGIAVMLLMQPSGGHLLFARTVLESFRSMPVGAAVVSSTFLELPGRLVQQSLLLGLRVALPSVVAMSLLDMTLSFANRSSRWQLVPAIYTLRAGCALLILAATWPGIAEAVSNSVLESLRLCGERLIADAA
jgi:flagellar biosynthesis protein FliR